MRVPLKQAQGVAAELLALLAGYCDRVEVCGSIRRRAPEVGDLDIIAVASRTPTGLFEEPDLAQTTDALHARLDELRDRGVITPWRDVNARGCWGPRLKRFSFDALDVQVQSVDDECFGVWQVIRTGPADYSHALVMPRSQSVVIKSMAGGSVTRPGLLPPGFEVKEGFRLYRAGGFVPTPDERDVYDALGLPYIEPWERR